MLAKEAFHSSDQLLSHFSQHSHTSSTSLLPLPQVALSFFALLLFLRSNLTCPLMRFLQLCMGRTTSNKALPSDSVPLCNMLNHPPHCFILLYLSLSISFYPRPLLFCILSLSFDPHTASLPCFLHHSAPPLSLLTFFISADLTNDKVTEDISILFVCSPKR